MKSNIQLGVARPYRRQQLATELFYNPGIRVHNELASKLITSNDHKNCPILPSLAAITKIKSNVKLSPSSVVMRTKQFSHKYHIPD